MKNLIVCMSFIALAAPTLAQNARFIGEGDITYQKKVNVYALLDQVYKDDAWEKPFVDNYKNNNPQFATSNSQLVFTEKSSYFKNVETEAKSNSNFGNFSLISQKNEVYQNFATHTGATLKPVFEEKFLVKDSLAHIKWKITEETREIAGFECRRANGLLMDSVYVVAFYTDKIIPSGGPESFNGLPGMILGIALPHYHVSWFATKVNDRAVKPEEIFIPNKGKPTDNKSLIAILKDKFRNADAAYRKTLLGYFL